MPQSRLNCPWIATSTECPVSKVMAQSMRSQQIGSFGHLPVPLDHSLDRSGGYPPVEPILDERGGGFGGKAPRLVEADQLEDSLLR